LCIQRVRCSRILASLFLLYEVPSMEIKLSFLSGKTFRYFKLLIACAINIYFALNNPWYVTLCTAIGSILFLYTWDHFKEIFIKPTAKDFWNELERNIHFPAILIGIITAILMFLVWFFGSMATKSFFIAPWYAWFIGTPGLMMIPGLLIIYLIRLWAEKTH
jgi:hypothetical protein